jgi:3-oxoadipate enol-lactonase
MVWLLPAGLDLPFPLKDRYHELAGGLEGKTPTEAVEAIMSSPDKVAEAVQTPWRWEIERVLWEHDDFDSLARAIHGVVDDWPIPDRELLRRVAIPALIVGMEGDEIHPAALARLLAELLPHAELLILQDQEDLFRRIPELVERVSSFLLGEG